VVIDRISSPFFRRKSPQGRQNNRNRDAPFRNNPALRTYFGGFMKPASRGRF